jgi:hypothetical protein
MFDNSEVDYNYIKTEKLRERLALVEGTMVQAVKTLHPELFEVEPAVCNCNKLGDEGFFSNHGDTGDTGAVFGILAGIKLKGLGVKYKFRDFNTTNDDGEWYDVFEK